MPQSYNLSLELPKNSAIYSVFNELLSLEDSYTLLLNRLENNEENGDDEKESNGADDHTTDGAYTE
jgi:hypothetical protein